MTASLAYRKHEDAILSGDVPEKYTRLVPLIPGQRILEIGSAEGVLALLLAKAGKQVTALEKNEDRHASALNLYSAWLSKENHFQQPTFVNGHAADCLHLLDSVDTLVAVRVIYYLAGTLNTIFKAVSEKVPNVVLCGNKNRAARWRAGMPDEPLGDFNRYAASEGMIELLERHGYSIRCVVKEGDEIVVGGR
jgi:SAM-dependent methyltransferase